MRGKQAVVFISVDLVLPGASVSVQPQRDLCDQDSHTSPSIFPAQRNKRSSCGLCVSCSWK